MVQKVRQFHGHLPQQEPSIISVHFMEGWLERLLSSNKIFWITGANRLYTVIPALVSKRKWIYYDLVGVVLLTFRTDFFDFLADSSPSSLVIFKDVYSSRLMEAEGFFVLFDI